MKELEQLKSLTLKIQVRKSKRSVMITEKKGTCLTNHTNQGHIPTEVSPVIDFTDKPVIQCDVPVVRNNL